MLSSLSLLLKSSLSSPFPLLWLKLWCNFISWFSFCYLFALYLLFNSFFFPSHTLSPTLAAPSPLRPLLTPQAPLIQGYWRDLHSQSCDHWAGSVPRSDSHYKACLAVAAPTHLAGWQRCPMLPLSNNPLLYQQNAGATFINEPPRCPEELSQNQDCSGEILKMKRLLTPIWGLPLSAMYSNRDGGMSEAEKAKEEEEEENVKQTGFENRLAIRQSLLSHENTPPPPASKPCHPSPQCEGHPDRQPRKLGLQTVTTLISADKSLECLILAFFLCRMLNTLWNKGLPLGCSTKIFLWQETTKINSYDLYQNNGSKKSSKCKCCAIIKMCKHWALQRALNWD